MPFVCRVGALSGVAWLRSVASACRYGYKDQSLEKTGGPVEAKRDKTRSIPEAERQAYTAAYARPGRMRAGWAYFIAFPQTAKDFAQLSQTKLTMAVLSIGEDKANGQALAQQVKLVATNAASVVLSNTGHWLYGGESTGDRRRADALSRRRTHFTCGISPCVPCFVVCARPDAADA